VKINVTCCVIGQGVFLQQVTMRPQQLQQAVSNMTVSHPATPQAANHVTPSRSSSVKRPVPGMIQSTLDSSRKSRPTSSLRTTGEFSQMSNLPTASFSRRLCFYECV